MEIAKINKCRDPGFEVSLEMQEIAAGGCNGKNWNLLLGVCDDIREAEQLSCNGKIRVLYTGEKMSSQKNSRRKRHKAADLRVWDKGERLGFRTQEKNGFSEKVKMEKIQARVSG